MKVDFDPEDYNNNIQCYYDYGENTHGPVYQWCARHHFLGIDIPLCESCGYHFEGMKLCNECYQLKEKEREEEWLDANMPRS